MVKEIEKMAAAYARMNGKQSAANLMRSYASAPDWKKRAVDNLFKLGYGMWSDIDCSDVVYSFLVDNVVDVSMLSHFMGAPVGVLYWATEDNGLKKIADAIDRFEEEYPGKHVYHVVSNPDPFHDDREMLTLLYVNEECNEGNRYEEGIEDYTESYNSLFKRHMEKVFSMNAYVTGTVPSPFDEFGSVAVASQGGGLIRLC